VVGAGVIVLAAVIYLAGGARVSAALQRS
jgi:hypothetical protein